MDMDFAIMDFAMDRPLDMRGRYTGGRFVSTYALQPGTIGGRHVAQAGLTEGKRIALNIMRSVTMVAVTLAMGMYLLYD